MRIYQILFIYFFLLTLKAIALETIILDYSSIDYSAISVYTLDKKPLNTPCDYDYSDY